MFALSKRALPVFALATVLIFVLFTAAVRPVQAASIVVNSAADIVADDGECTLREAIIAANTDTASGATAGECAAGSGADTITFAADYTITLAGSQLPVITTAMTITGNGPANTIIQANANPNTATYRVFQILFGELTLDGVNIRHGRCEQGCNTAANVGGGILNDGTLTVTNSTLSDNSAVNSAVNFGGGIYNVGTLTVTNSTLSGNSAGTDGGGIYNASGTATVTNSTITGNTAQLGGGGGIYNAATLTVTNSTITGNSADNGGGIYNASGTATVTNSTLSGNSAGIGGGISNRSGTLTVTNSTLSGNSAQLGGGGILNDRGTLTVTNSTLSGNSAVNSAVNFGGGIYNVGTLTVTNSTLSGNSTVNSAVNFGGGIYNLATLTVTNSTLSGNSANYGGGIINRFNGTTTLVGSLIAGNNALSDGDEIYLDDGIINTNAFNVFGDSSKTSASAFGGYTPGASDLTATSDGTNPTALAAILDTTLQNNGGPTETHALVAGSPAIDFAPSVDCAAAPVNGLDQRGEPRSIDIPGEGNDGGGDLCDTGAFEVQLPPVTSICPVDAPGVGNELTTLLGRGMGSPTRTKMVAKIVIPNASDVTDLYGQMAAKQYNGIRYVRFIFGDKTYVQVQPETDLGQTAAISWWGADLDETKLQQRPFIKGRWFLLKGMKKMNLPRAIVVYATHDTGDADYANAWSTFTSQTNFVAGTPGFPQSNTSLLPIPETQAAADITVQIAVTDVNRDPRTVDVIVTAGSVSQTVTLTGPTNKKSELLNLFEVTLEGVAAGVDEVEIELVSVLDEGDSAGLLGAAASYVCEPSAP